LSEEPPGPDWREALRALERLSADAAGVLRRLDEATRPSRERFQAKLARVAPAIEAGAAAAQRALNAAADSLAPLYEAAQRYYEHLDRIARDLDQLVPLARRGWALSVFGLLMAPNAHERAAAVASTDEEQASDDLLDGWSDPSAQLLACSLVPYVYPPEQRPLATRRQELLDRAVEHFREGRYEEVVLLIYSQLDGIFQDKADEVGVEAFGRLFSRRPVPGTGSEQFEDLVGRSETVLADEESFFLLIRDAMTTGIDRSTLLDHPSRHGVLHGRVLGYGTRLRAAQAFAFLAASMELLAALEDDVPLTDEEAAETELGELPIGLKFRLHALIHAPVRSVFVANRDRALSFAADEPGGGRTPSQAISNEGDDPAREPRDGS
jgi:hypothetical protein